MQKAANNRTWGFTWSYHITSRTCSASASREKHNKARRYIYIYIYNRPIREIYFYLLKLRKRKKKLQQVAYAEFRFIFVLRERKPRRQKAASYFSLGLFYKSTKICFYCECTQIKANLLQLRLSLWLKVVASTVRRKKIKWLLRRRMRAHSSALLPWQCSLACSLSL